MVCSAGTWHHDKTRIDLIFMHLPEKSQTTLSKTEGSSLFSMVQGEKTFGQKLIVLQTTEGNQLS